MNSSIIKWYGQPWDIKKLGRTLIKEKSRSYVVGGCILRVFWSLWKYFLIFLYHVAWMCSDGSWSSQDWAIAHLVLLIRRYESVVFIGLWTFSFSIFLTEMGCHFDSIITCIGFGHSRLGVWIIWLGLIWTTARLHRVQNWVSCLDVWRLEVFLGCLVCGISFSSDSLRA